MASQSSSSEHVRRRASAAAAAEASEIRPINAKKAGKRPARPAKAGHALASAPLAAAVAAPSDALPTFDAAVEGLPITSGKASEPPAVPPGPLPRNERGEPALLQERAGIDADENYGSHEYALSSYLKLHPVLSLESTSCQTLQLVADLVEDTSIPTKELEIVPKPHDDEFLRPPNVAKGERPCCFGDRCICVWMARWRYGDDTDMAFIGTEFLLPSQAAEFKRSGKLPHTQGKCLVCSRYVTTYIYRCARADPTFRPSASIPLQAFGNALGVEAGENVPTHSSVANDVDGYRQEALLFVDEQWADTAAARGGMASLLWRPCVKFLTTHYVYVKDPSGLPRLIQRNRSRSVFEPELEPLFSDFEDAGMHGALARLRLRLREYAPTLVVPEWVWSLDYGFAVTECARDDGVPALLETLASAARALTSAGSRKGGAPPSATKAPTTSFQRAAIVRVHLGELLEALTAHVAHGLVRVDHAPARDVNKQELATLYYDAYCVAVWSSAHAEYLGCIDELLGDCPATEERVRDFMVPSPELHTVANFGHLLHLDALTERTASARFCSKPSQALLAILARVTNAGSRGWETTLLTALKESEGAVRVCMQSLAVALSGLHPAIHPGARRPWRERFVLLRALRVHTQQDFKEVVQKAPNAIKEAVRLHLAATFLADRATYDAMRHTCHPTGWLCVPPIDVPAGPLAAAMHRMADAGASMVATRESAAAAIRRHLVSQPRSRKKPESRASRQPKHEVETLSYSSSWLGGRSGPSGQVVHPAVQVVSGLLSASYRSIWIPFWLHGNHHGYRASRLDSAQYTALHSQSAAHRMCTLLPDAQFQKAERVALANADASLISVSRACALLGIRPNSGASPGMPCSASTRAVQDAEVEVMNLCADDAALLMAFARIAMLRSALLSYDLGTQTRRRQSLAICQRLLLPLAPGEDPCEAVRTRLPQHATVLYCCSECRRVVNSVQDNTGKDVAFNEIGLTASMLTVDCTACSSHMRCAKRSTAALRTAVALEASAEQLELEQLEPVATPLLPRDLRPATIVSTMCVSKGGGGGSAANRRESGLASGSAPRDSSSEVAKFRRDLKSCFEQGERATSCGDVPLVCVPILGRAVRVFGSWYALCSICGALARVTPMSRFRDEICCLRCDFAMLAGKTAANEMRAALHKPTTPSCRFCGKAEPENGAGMKWRRIPAPTDTGGRNAFVPPPLRVVWYCPTHYRGWLVAAHTRSSMSEIFAHLLNKARPIHGADVDAGGKRRRLTPADTGENACESEPTPVSKRVSAATKRKSALTRVISKNNRQRRLARKMQ